MCPMSDERKAVFLELCFAGCGGGAAYLRILSAFAQKLRRDKRRDVSR